MPTVENNGAGAGSPAVASAAGALRRSRHAAAWEAAEPAGGDAGMTAVVASLSGDRALGSERTGSERVAAIVDCTGAAAAATEDDVAAAESMPHIKSAATYGDAPTSQLRNKVCPAAGLALLDASSLCAINLMDSKRPGVGCSLGAACTAAPSGQIPRRLRRKADAPASSKQVTTGGSPCLAAQNKGVQPPRSPTSTCAPNSNSKETASPLLPLAALHNGVLPLSASSWSSKSAFGPCHAKLTFCKNDTNP
mmetsp:Transcript_75295/g.218671  ORF Transcript_75295/g.218671 Transcript_75295/m.218671 type:complete len:251 (+) Transcript_75295:1739-2491(+)